MKITPTDDSQKISLLIIAAIDKLQGRDCQQSLLKLKLAILNLQDWEKWFQQGCGHQPPAEEVFQLIDEIELLLCESRESLETNLNEIRTDLEKAHILARPLACKCRKLCKH
jgi:hypothetical protein